MVVHSRDNQFELNTLKISQETKRVVRKPYVWTRPNARLYDYHYEVGGLYYQPMISYIISRGGTGPSSVVDIPDRILSNFDRRAYELKDPEVDMEDFLTEAYKRRTKDINSKYVHVENEKVRHSKKTTDLNMVRGSACIRDKYLCQLQLYYTGSGGTLPSEEEDMEFLSKKEDTSYGPGYKKVTVRHGKQPREKRYSQILEEQFHEQDSVLKKDRMTEYLGYLTSSTKEALNRVNDTKEVTKEQDKELEPANSTYMFAMKDVKKTIDTKRKEIEEVPTAPLDLKISYSGRAIDTLGSHERTRLKADQFKPRKMPDIDVGYDTVKREHFCID